MKSLIALLLLFAALVQAQVPNYDILMTPADYNLLYTRDIFSDSTLPCTFEFQGSPWNTSQMRFKGHSTRYYPKKGYNVKVPTSHLFQNLRSISFNSMYSDKSYMREHLAWNLYADMQEMASRPHYGNLSINGIWKGLYLFIDKPDKYFLANRGRVVAPLYEASDTYIGADFTVQPDSIMKLYYDKSIGDVNNYSDLEALINAVNAAPDSSYADTIHSYFDVSSLLNWFAGNILMMMGDSYNKNYLLYRDTSKPSQQWVVIPWDYDLSFGRSGDLTMPYPASLLNDDFAYTFPPLSGPPSVLKDRFWATPSLREELRAHVDKLLQTVFTEAKQFRLIDSLASEIKNDAALDTYKWGTTDEFYEHVEALKYYVTARRNYLNKTFVNPPGGLYDDVTLPVSQINVPYHFVGYDGRLLATLWFTSMNGLDSVRVRAYSDSVPPNLSDPGSGRFVKRWITVTPYPSNADFTAKFQWSYEDVAANNREVGAGVQDEHLLRCFQYDGASWNALSGKINAFGNFVTIDSINESNCGPGKHFALLISETYTQTWFRKPLTNWQRWYDVKFADAQHGFVVGDHGTIMRTTDAGASWLEDTVAFSLPLHAIAIPSLRNIFTVGENGACYRSVDSGKSWFRVDLGTKSNLHGVVFATLQMGWIFGDHGLLKQTTNAGATWENITVDSTKSFSALVPVVIPSNIMAFADSGVFYRINPTTLTWQKGDIGATRTVRNALNNLSILWVIGDSGMVRVSIDQGGSWIPADISSHIRLEGISSFSLSKIYVSGENGKIFYTTNGGSNWYSQYSADSHDLYGLAFTDSTHGYAVGNGGTILVTTTNGTVTDVKSSPPKLPSEFLLYQNYPNPFNPATEIRYELRDAGYVTLKVYDVLGRQVATIVNQVLLPGEHTTNWDASGVASGVYFYRLEVSGLTPRTTRLTEVRKMLYLK